METHSSLMQQEVHMSVKDLANFVMKISIRHNRGMLHSTANGKMRKKTLACHSYTNYCSLDRFAEEFHEPMMVLLASYSILYLLNCPGQKSRYCPNCQIIWARPLLKD
eukprot:TRINITY_DN88052_c0_g1_i1.p1 TRINITY_DN88052_c0_g1~~TRINITY_DN88052_c0_g1_i1.p1  ORF type:complete len:108 (+),score=5.90 TRINITY_DN88052_c0_g1_i1:405-728(+)